MNKNAITFVFLIRPPPFADRNIDP